jgi:hypothetical protein
MQERACYQDHKRDKPSIEGMGELSRKGTKQGGRAHWLDAQDQIVLWSVEVKRTHEGTTTMAAWIAH